MLDTAIYVGGDYPRLILKDSSDTPEGDAWHEIPIQAIADRMELLGLESIEQALEYIGHEFHNSEVSDELHEPMQRAYQDVVQSEYAQTLMPTPQVDDVQRQTLFEPMQISPSKRDKLRDTRAECLKVVGMRSMIHSEPMVRVMDASRPVERTRPAAAEALNGTEEAIEEAVRLVQENLEEVKAWRGRTLLSFTPQLLHQLRQEVEV